MIMPNRNEPAGAMEDAGYFDIVVAGEFNSGKSSIINLLLQKEVLPAKVQVSALPPARIIPATAEHYDIRGAKSGEPLGKDDLFHGAAEVSIGSIDIAVPLEKFNGARISEVSVDQGGTLSAEGRAVLANADLLIWATMGQRAWCLSEITIVEALPARLRKTAILAVTRSDYLHNTEDLAKVRARLLREATRYFGSILMLDSSRKSVSAAKEPALWQQSGGEALFDNVQREFKKSPLYGRAAQDAPARVAEPETYISHENLASAWAEELADFTIWLQAQRGLQDLEAAQYLWDRMQGFSEVLLPMGAQGGNSGQALAFKQAAAYLGNVISETGRKDCSMLAVDLAVQLLREMQSKALFRDNEASTFRLSALAIQGG